MNLIGKKILIVCREVDSLPYYFLAKRWMKNNTVAAYFIKASETKFHKIFLMIYHTLHLKILRI